MQKFRRVFEGIAKAGQSTDLNDFYTELFITEGVSGEVNKEHEVRLIETASRKPAKEETPIKCEDIFKPLPGQDQPSRTIMTTGVAGIGKTILTHKFTLDWAEGKANQDIHFTLPFTFRELNLLKEKEFSLMELLHHFFIQTKGILRYDLFQVVFILDGLDECRLPLDFQNNPIWTDVTKSTSVDILLTNLIRGDLLPSARIWITTRPAAANQIPAECVDMVTEVRGFTDPQKEEYFILFLLWVGEPSHLCHHANTLSRDLIGCRRACGYPDASGGKQVAPDEVCQQHVHRGRLCDIGPDRIVLEVQRQSTLIQTVQDEDHLEPVISADSFGLNKEVMKKFHQAKLFLFQ
ncbi:hypothetical protein NHX12_015895 [Muraenolepis orangiensis]|uniref:NACHT domain-containing protein n=1 Tax=Muraenolepis orangiensis TaxID=630683 RepID=A0A9Q0D8L5_9TELE|nr:hypothetical protein NHX12_015895 [Muraenolepis orangiensis]